MRFCARSHSKSVYFPWSSSPLPGGARRALGKTMPGSACRPLLSLVWWYASGHLRDHCPSASQCLPLGHRGSRSLNSQLLPGPFKAAGKSHRKQPRALLHQNAPLLFLGVGDEASSSTIIKPRMTLESPRSIFSFEKPRLSEKRSGLAKTCFVPTTEKENSLTRCLPQHPAQHLNL